MGSDGTRGPLEGLRVIELGGELSRMAGKVLAECGASVARIGRHSPGPAMVDPDLAARGGLLDWWAEGGKRWIDLDLDDPDGQDTYRRLCAHADLVIETQPPGELGARGLDHPDLVASNPRLVQVALTPFGRTGPRSDWQTSDLVTAAWSGVLSLSGTPDAAVNPWGRQHYTFGSLMAVISGLAGVHAARETGTGAFVDLSLHEVMTSEIENLFFQWWFADLMPFLPQRALRQGSLHWLGAYVVANARTGACNVAPTPQGAPLFAWMAEEGDEEGKALAAMPPEESFAQMPRVMNAIRRFAATKDSGELFHEAQRRHVAFGEVQTVAQVAANPQYEHRGTFRSVEGFPAARLPGPIARFSATPCSPPQPPPDAPTDVDTLLAGWRDVEPAPPSPAEHYHEGPGTAGKPLAGLRVVDFTWVLAGPNATRILGDLGADVLKFQTAERATLVNSADFPYFYVWNRSKRLVSLDMKRPEALEVIRAVVEHSDVLMENFSAGVLERWGIGYEQVREWNPGIVYVTMSGPGHDGPWSRMITYAPTIHALCGLTYLSNPPDRLDVGPGYSLNDHAAGLAAASAVLAAIEARRRTGAGQHLDIAQMETGTTLIGPAMLDYFANGREAHPVGNADPFGQWCPNEVLRCGDQREVAITCRDDEDWARMCDVLAWDIDDLAADPTLGSVEGRLARRDEIAARLRRWCVSRTAAAATDALQAVGVPAGVVQDAGDLMADPQHVARGFWRSFDHAVFGPRPFDRFPAIWSTTDLEPYLPSGAYLGEHNFEVYAELAGLDPDRIADGLADGLFG